MQTVETIKEIPMLFSTEMVRAIIEGRKTQTRRIVKPQPIWDDQDKHWHFQAPKWSDADYAFADRLENCSLLLEQCPYGKAGDIIWVRESFANEAHHHTKDNDGYDGKSLWYKADLPEGTDGSFIKWKPPIHMPKSAARIWLRVDKIRVERLGDISDADAIAEGVDFDYTEADGRAYVDYLEKHPSGKMVASLESAKESYRTLWESINGHDSYAANPWVWVVSFTVLSTTGKPVL